MNRTRRKELSQIIDRIEALKPELERLQLLRDDIATDLERIRDEEQDAYDSLPESLQEAERGQDMEQAISDMTSALDEFDNIELAADFDEIIRNIDDARGQG